ncbi:MAG: MaoC family dehydratase [Polyangiaceae bacterium]
MRLTAGGGADKREGVLRAHRYGRKLDDFTAGAVFEHPWEVTVDEGMLALFHASFQCALPTYSSKLAARAAGLADRPVHPLWLLNLGISFSVHDVSEQAIANLAYIDVRFPNACYAGDTVRARSRVIGVKPVSSGDKGVVHVQTHLVNERDELLCSFERKALVRAGSAERPADPKSEATWPAEGEEGPARLPEAMRAALSDPSRELSRPRFATAWEDMEPGDVFAHEVGRTVSDAELLQLTTLARNSHPLHTDEVYCKTGSFAKTRVAYGGLVLSWVLALGSRDTVGNGVWDLGLDDGAHTGSVLAGDTLFAATKVLSREAWDARTGVVTLRVVGTKNVPPRALLAKGASLFEAELPKTEGRVPEKVVEITRRVLVQRRRA